MCMLSFEDVIT